MNVRKSISVLLIMIATMAKARWVGVPNALKAIGTIPKPAGRFDDTAIGYTRLKSIDETILKIVAQPWMRLFISPRRTCLARALALSRYAVKYCMPLRIHFGVRLENDKIKGHCWVSAPNGDWVVETPREDDHYQEIWSHSLMEPAHAR